MELKTFTKIEVKYNLFYFSESNYGSQIFTERASCLVAKIPKSFKKLRLTSSDEKFFTQKLHKLLHIASFPFLQ